jgi:hypothetical protein
MRMLKHFAVVILAEFGDPTYLVRVWGSLLVGGGVVVLGYWLAAPDVLPLWPGVLGMLIAAIVGVAWEVRARQPAP